MKKKGNSKRRSVSKGTMTVKDARLEARRADFDRTVKESSKFSAQAARGGFTRPGGKK